MAAKKPAKKTAAPAKKAVPSSNPFAPVPPGGTPAKKAVPPKKKGK